MSQAASTTECQAIVPFAADGPAALLQAIADERMQQRRVIKFPPESAVGDVEIQQLPGKALGAYAWTAGIHLACHVEGAYAGRLQGLRMLELGSGTGITAIALAKLGACVMATDLFPELVVLMRKNIASAGLSSDLSEAKSCKALPFEWGKPLKGALAEPFDLVIGSEITYNEGGFQPLEQTLCDLCEAAEQASRAPPSIIIAETLRNPRQQEFWANAGRRFLVREIAVIPQQDTWNVRNAVAPVRVFSLQWRGAGGSVPSRPPDAVPGIQVVCPRIDSPAAAMDALKAHGACILTGCQTDCESRR